MKYQQLLIIDDEENLRHMLSVMLRKQGYVTASAADGREALEKLAGQVFDYILCDIRMPGMDGRQFLQQAIARGITTPIIMMTAYGSIDTAVACMQDGAYDFISKPFKQDEIIIVLKKAEERERLKEELRALKSENNAGAEAFCGLVGHNQAMLALQQQIERVSSLKTTVLIRGESGTGKELVARALHTSGIRQGKPFVAINCGAIPENMLESELFGHVKGAFTGAINDKAGLFELAHAGTLFLDEVGEMPLSLQVKLLRVLQEGEVRRIGAEYTRHVDVRIVSATAKDLQAEVSAGRFREDLLFRLNVFTLALPPLRDRMDDLPLLVQHFIRSCAKRLGLEAVPRMQPEAMRQLLSYGWPGNVRELENVIERALLFCEGNTITPQDLSFGEAGILAGQQADQSSENLSIKQAERTLEIDLIRKALLKTGGNRTHAAKILEISHRALLYKLKEYQLE